jgi:hypothetical protein
VIARSILQMRDAHPDMFCPQDWYVGENFAHRALMPVIGLPTHLARCPQPPHPEHGDLLTDAVLLVGLYLRYPLDAIFRGYLWTADTDALGQRVYVGGTSNGRGLEIHRHLHLTERWSVPVWR